MFMVSCAQQSTIINTPEDEDVLLLKYEEYRHVDSTLDYTSLNPVPRSLPTIGWRVSKCLSEIPWLKKQGDLCTYLYQQWVNVIPLPLDSNDPTVPFLLPYTAISFQVF